MGNLAKKIFGSVETQRNWAEEIKNVNTNLSNFDDLDFNVFTRQKWDELHKSHSNDVRVHWPDGRTTQGIEKHIEDLKVLFAFSPDARITAHPIRMGQGDWTAVTGVMEGTFTQPMRLPDGRVIQPTNQKFKIEMCTLGHWREGVMDEEYLFFDNQAFMKQLGIASY